MPAPIAIQLYTVRDMLAKDFEGVVKKIADIGYAGVETAGSPGITPEAAGKLFQDLGLEVPSVHIAPPVGEKKQEVLDTMHALGSRRIVSGQGSDGYKTPDLIRNACDLFNEASEVAGENGMTYGIHNHWWEFLLVEGRPVYQLILDHVVPEVFFQVDTFWVRTAGVDPVAVVRELGPRAPLLHIKDGPDLHDATMKPEEAEDYETHNAIIRKRWEASDGMTAAGEGVLDFPGIVEAAAGSTEWMILEMDRCSTDMMEAAEKSYAYLTGEGLARGSKG